MSRPSWMIPGWKVPEPHHTNEMGDRLELFSAGAVGERIWFSMGHNCGPLEGEVGITTLRSSPIDRSQTIGVGCVVRLEDLEWAVAELRKQKEERASVGRVTPGPAGEGRA